MRLVEKLKNELPRQDQLNEEEEKDNMYLCINSFFNINLFILIGG